MLQRVVVSGADISERKLVEEVVGEHQKEHVRMDSRGYKGTYIRRKYDHSTNLENQKNYEIFVLIKKKYPR